MAAVVKEKITTVVQLDKTVAVVVAGTQGPPGRNGVDGATISPDPDNRLENRPNGLYVQQPAWANKEW